MKFFYGVYVQFLRLLTGISLLGGVLLVVGGLVRLGQRHPLSVGSLCIGLICWVIGLVVRDDL